MKAFDMAREKVGKPLAAFNDNDTREFVETFLSHYYNGYFKQNIKDEMSIFDMKVIVVWILNTVIAELCMEILFPASGATAAVCRMKAELDFFKFDTLERLRKTISGNLTDNQMHIDRDRNLMYAFIPDIPKLLFSGARLFWLAGGKYRGLKEINQAKGAYGTAAVYIKSADEALKSHKCAFGFEYGESSIVLLDNSPVADKCQPLFGAAVERELELSAGRIELLSNKIKVQLAELSDKQEV